jgi:hypothetical protein
MKPYLTACAAVVFSASVNAEELRSIPFSEAIMDAENNVILDSSHAEHPERACAADNTCPPLTLGVIAARALSVETREDRLPPEQKAKQGALAVKVLSGGNQPMQAEDIALIKSVIGKLWGPVIVHRAWQLLDPKPAK